MFFFPYLNPTTYLKSNVPRLKGNWTICLWSDGLVRATDVCVYQPKKDKMIIQKQPSRGDLRKSCSEIMQQIYRRKPMPKCDFNKVVTVITFCHIL